MGERRGRRGEEGRGEDQGGDERRTRGEGERDDDVGQQRETEI
jgi:hypothetical protein